MSAKLKEIVWSGAAVYTTISWEVEFREQVRDAMPDIGVQEGVAGRVIDGGKVITA
jgi:hypothetical protein